MRYALAFALLAGSVLISAQSTPPAGPVFEVASVKPNPTGSYNSTTRTLPGGFQATNTQVDSLIAYAYGVRPNQIAGAPAWTQSSRFDIQARTTGDPSGDDIRRMLRALLVDRFNLALHTETRDQSIYALVVARDDARLGADIEPSTRDCSGGATPCGVNMTTDGRGGSLRGTAISLQELAGTLTGIVGRTVVDRTGLTGAFDVTLRYARETAATVDRPTGVAGDAPSIFSAIQEQLGLKLESARGPVEFLVIDRIEQLRPD